MFFLLRFIFPGSFVPEFEDKIDSLPLNKISEPFSTQFGWHILEVLGKRDQDNTEIIMQNLARQYITSSRTREVIDAWFIELKEQNFIKYVSENNKKNQRNNRKMPFLGPLWAKPARIPPICFFDSDVF